MTGKTTTAPDETQITQTTAYTLTGKIASVQNAELAISYTYDALDRLVTSRIGETAAEYTYQPDGMRLSKTYKYDAFGNEISPDPGDANPLRYAGEQYDAETGLYYLRARYYDAGIGRLAKRLMDERYGHGNYSTGLNTEYNKKRGDRAVNIV